MANASWSKQMHPDQSTPDFHSCYAHKNHITILQSLYWAFSQWFGIKELQDREASCNEIHGHELSSFPFIIYPIHTVQRLTFNPFKYKIWIISLYNVSIWNADLLNMLRSSPQIASIQNGEIQTTKIHFSLRKGAGIMPGLINMHLRLSSNLS